MPHLLSIKDLNQATVLRLLDRAEQLLQEVVKPNRQLAILNGQIAANLFFEASTRTQFSFSIAAHRLGALMLNPLMSHTSTVKGESLLDTVRTFIAMGSRLIIIRHREEHIPEWLAAEISDQASIINAGDGSHQHPTQALLDLLTIRQYKGDFSKLKIVIIGDVAHSRVARSLVEAAHLLGCTQLGVIAPPEFLPSDIDRWPVTHYDTMAAGLANADVVMSLRIQLERIALPPSAPHPTEFLQKFRLTAENLRLAHPQAIVMHPAPINRETEITSAVADGPQSVILPQVTNGVAMRMAIMEWLLCLKNLN